MTAAENIENYRVTLEASLSSALKHVHEDAKATVTVVDTPEGLAGIAFDVNFALPFGAMFGVSEERFEGEEGELAAAHAEVHARTLTSEIGDSIVGCALAIARLPEYAFAISEPAAITEAEVDAMLAEINAPVDESEIEASKVLEDVLAHGIPEDEQ